MTPPIALVREIAAEVSLPLRVMVRENAGYTTSPLELLSLQRAAAALAELQIDGLVVGFAAPGKIELKPVSHVMDAAPGIKVTFHRAFDQLRDPLAALDAVAGIRGIDRILTSGGKGPSTIRCQRLRAYQERAGSCLTIVAGGDADVEMLSAIVRTGVVREVHVGRAARERHDPEAAVAAAKVSRLREIIEKGQ